MTSGNTQGVSVSSSKNKTKINSNRGPAGINPVSEGLSINLLRLMGVLPLYTMSAKLNLQTLKSEQTIIIVGFAQ